MAFCKYCGRELNDGEVCTCRQTSQQTAQTQTDNGSVSNPSSQIYNQATAIKDRIATADYHSFADFIKLYFRNPDRAARLGAEHKDMVSMIICAVLFIFTNGLAQYSLVMKLSVFSYNFEGTKAFMFIFGLIYGLFGILVPPALNILTASISKANLSRRNLFRENILHTLSTSVMLLLSFILGILSPALTIIGLVITVLVYIASMSSLITKSLVQRETIINKFLLVGIILGFIIAFIILLLIESACIGDAFDKILNNLF